MKFKASQLPLEVDVWNEIEADLKTGLKDVLYLRFNHTVDLGCGRVVIKHSENNEVVSKRFEIDNVVSERLVFRLAKRFNFSWHQIYSLTIKLEPGEIPIFNASFYPYVNESSTLNTTKSRMNPIMTIDWKEGE